MKLLAVLVLVVASASASFAESVRFVNGADVAAYVVYQSSKVVNPLGASTVAQYVQPGQTVDVCAVPGSSFQVRPATDALDLRTITVSEGKSLRVTFTIGWLVTDGTRLVGKGHLFAEESASLYGTLYDGMIAGMLLAVGWAIIGLMRFAARSTADTPAAVLDLR